MAIDEYDERFRPSKSLKPIETRYKGYRFRSRLEARWAVFFEAAGCHWEYEKQGYEINGERYLPDFWLQDVPENVWSEGTPPVSGRWVEIKPGPLTEREERLLRNLAVQSRHKTIALCGSPYPGDFAIFVYMPKKTYSGTWVAEESFWLPNDCYFCGGTGCQEHVTMLTKTWKGQEFDYLSAGECTACKGSGNDSSNESLVWKMDGYAIAGHWDVGLDTSKLEGCLTAARSARFEHGESPK